MVDRSLLENLHSRAYSLYLLLLKAEQVPGNNEQLREVLFIFCSDLSQDILGV